MFRKLVDDSFHYMDEDERHQDSSFGTSDAALARATQTVDRCLESQYRAGITAGALDDAYVAIGDDPFIVSDGDETVEFSAWQYARRRCEDLCAHDTAPDADGSAA